MILSGLEIAFVVVIALATVLVLLLKHSRRSAFEDSAPTLYGGDAVVLQIAANGPTANNVNVKINGTEIAGNVQSLRLDLKAGKCNVCVLRFIPDRLDVETEAMLRTFLAEEDSKS